MPTMATASPLSSFLNLLGNDAFASTGTSFPEIKEDTSKNSQTMALLQSSGSSSLVFQDKKSKEAVDEIMKDVNVNILSDNALLPTASPVGTPYATMDSSESSPFEQISVYVVRKGDNISQIAEMFEISVNTILWNNNMKKGDKLAEGDILFILPVSGVEHQVTKGQTIQSIAKFYKVDANDIANYNSIDINDKLAIGDKFIVPDAQKAEEGDKPIKNLEASIAKDRQYYENHPIQNLAGYFINPVPGARKSQGLHDRTAVDLAIAKGTPILAAAAGRVTLARNGYNGGFGNMVIISHPNGTETLYAHMSKLGTTTGAQVYQGQIIGYVGSTGRSTGPHLHLEVHGARNPGIDGSWKY